MCRVYRPSMNKTVSKEDTSECMNRAMNFSDNNEMKILKLHQGESI